ILFRVGGVVGGDGVHRTIPNPVQQGLDVVGGADGGVDPVIAGVVREPEVVGGHLAGDRRAPELGDPDGLHRAPGGNVAHVQPGLVVLAQPTVADRFDVLGQAVVPGADLHILG